jgi:methionine synthase II (cobalamin-independent)
MDVMTLVDPASRAAVERAWEAALLRELAEIQAAIPAVELAITIDVVQGMLLWEQPDNVYVKPYFSDAGGYRPAIVERFARLANAVQPSVELGFHLCYGSQDHKHAFDPQDMSALVSIANSLTNNVGRRIDYWHMPVPRNRSDNAYFEPLTDLTIDEDSDVYLGLVHYSDGVEGTHQRMRSAARYLGEFGVATECGFGRRPVEQDILNLLKIHAEVVDTPY